MKAALFPNGAADPHAKYQCSQSFFKCDVLFNADPTVNNSVTIELDNLNLSEVE